MSQPTPAPAPATHSCPGGCGEQVRRSHFACPPCWDRLPLDLRRPIIRAYWAGQHEEHSRAMVIAMRWYLSH
jgi:hypothetical protein